MNGTLQLAISSKINDRDDFKKLILKSNENSDEIEISRGRDGIIICKALGKETHVSEDEVFHTIDDFINQGFNSITCQCWSSNTHIQIPAGGRGKLKITYSQPNIIKNINENSCLIDPEEASELLKSIEIMSIDGSISADMRRKYVQIDNFIKLIQPLLIKSTQKGKISILDCGSGKSYLSFVMNYFIREKLGRSCHFYCVDTNKELIEKCLEIRDSLGYDNMEFHVSQIRDFQPDEEIDIVCSLHACDTASDEAIAKGVQLNAPFLLIVPCCQHEVINQLTDHPLKAITRHGVYNARLADLLTDGLRTLLLEIAGYKVSVTEYVSPIYTPKNIMIQAEKIQSKNKMALEQYLNLKSTFGNLSIELEKTLPFPINKEE